SLLAARSTMRTVVSSTGDPDPGGQAKAAVPAASESEAKLAVRKRREKHGPRPSRRNIGKPPRPGR
ncbi:MAG TPA: hypothetical protein VHR72_04460, partial [Gemmataceae bacterium]|nr:hypothetical protein [Gemmataceae bacterium]